MKTQLNQNWQEAVKAVLRGKFINVKAYIKKERCHINNLSKTGILPLRN